MAVSEHAIPQQILAHFRCLLFDFWIIIASIWFGLRCDIRALGISLPLIGKKIGQFFNVTVWGHEVVLGVGVKGSAQTSCLVSIASRSVYMEPIPAIPRDLETIMDVDSYERGAGLTNRHQSIE